MNPHRIKAYFYLLCVTFIWGAASPIIKFTLSGISPLVFLTYRFGISSLISFILLFLTGLKTLKFERRLLSVFSYAFITTTFSLGFLFWGLQKTSVLDTAVITAVAPLTIAISGAIFLKEHITNQEKIGILIALIGVLLTIFEPLLQGRNEKSLTGNLLITLYLAGNAVSAILAKKLLRENFSPLFLANISFIIGFLTTLPLTLFLADINQIIYTLKNLKFQYHLGVIYMALISGNIGYTLWNKGQKTIEVGEAALFSYLYPLFSIPLAIFWLKEKITPIYILGTAIIFAGVVIAEYKKKRASIRKDLNPEN